jgi:hypothetical protein
MSIPPSCLSSVVITTVSRSGGRFKGRQQSSKEWAAYIRLTVQTAVMKEQALRQAEYEPHSDDPQANARRSLVLAYFSQVCLFSNAVLRRAM